MEIEKKNLEIVAITPEDKEKYKDKIKIFLAEPTQGVINYLAHDNRLDFYMNLARLEANSNYKFFTGNVGRLFISYAREIISERAIEAGMDYIFWVDDDMMLPFDTFERLIRHNVDMVSPLTFMRIPPYSPVMWEDSIGEDGNINFKQILKYPKDKLLPVSEIGFGVVLMKVDVLKKMDKPYFFHNVPIGEDIWFCYLAKQKGVQCYVDTSFCIGHLGMPNLITENEFLEYKEKECITTKKILDWGVKGTE